MSRIPSLPRRLTLLSTLALAGLAGLAACGDGGLPGPARTAGTRILLTDAPFPYDSIAQVNLHIERLEASVAQDSTSGPQPWVTIAEPKKVFNLLDYQNGATALLAEASMPTGRYRTLRMTIDVSKSGLVDRTGAPVAVNWGMSGQRTLHAFVQEPIDVEAGGGAIVIDFDVGRSFVCYGNKCEGGFWFIPVFRAVNADLAGTLVGSVRGGTAAGAAIANASIEVLPDGPQESFILWASPLATGRTDAAGTFKISYLVPGTYRVRITAPRASGFAAAGKTGLVVQAKQETQVGTIAIPNVADIEIAVAAPATMYANDSAVVTLRGAVDGDVVPAPDAVWSSSDPSVATVQATSAGMAIVWGKKAGTATITASSGARSASATIQVVDKPPPAPVASVQLNITPTSPFAGDSAGAYARLLDATGGELFDQRAVTWATSDPEVLAIKWSYGRHAILTPKKAGTATVSATADGKTGSVTVTVKSR